MRTAAAIAALALGCGRTAPVPPPPPSEAGPADAAVAEVVAQPLGLPTIADFGWRARGGQAAYRSARVSEEAGDWRAVEATCRQVLAADPGHLEAAWLLAVAYAKQGKLDEILAPLARAAAGDFGKWGQASLELPGMQPFLATPAGAAWRRRVEADRDRYVAALGRALVVSAGGELYAYEVDVGGRWHRLSRANGTLIGALAIPSARQIAYVTRNRRHMLGLGVIDLARGISSRPVPLGTSGPVTIAYSAAAPVGFWAGAPKQPWRQLDADYRFHAQRAPRPAGPWLDVTAKGTVHLHALPANVVADWDEQSLASAIRIGTSNRVVSVPSPGLIDGNSAAWSPDRVHVAFVAQLDDHCTAGAVNTAAFVADASTGGMRELARAADGIALSWVAERRLAVAGDHGVLIYSLDDTTPAAVEGATGLIAPRERPRCAPPEPGEPTEEDEITDAGE